MCKAISIRQAAATYTTTTTAITGSITRSKIATVSQQQTRNFFFATPRTFVATTTVLNNRGRLDYTTKMAAPQPPQTQPTNAGNSVGGGNGNGDGDGSGGKTATPTTPAPPPHRLPPPGFTIRRCDPATDIPRMVDIYLRAFAGGEYVYWWGPMEAMRAWSEARFALWFHNPAMAVFKVVDESEEGGGNKLAAFAAWVLPAKMRGPGFRAEVVSSQTQTQTEQQQQGQERGGGGHGGGGGENGDKGEGEREGVAVTEGGEKTAAEAGAETGKGKEDSNSSSHRTQHPSLPAGADAELYGEFFGRVARAGEKWGAGTEKLELSLLVADPDPAYRGLGLGTALVHHGFRAADAETPTGAGGVDVFLDAVVRAVPLYRRLGFVSVDRVEFPLARERGRVEAGTGLDIMVRTSSPLLS